MSLGKGDTLGPYEIVEPIGKGGMGEVYRARDPRTDRDVAIKISAEQFSGRFSREVRAIAALNHPNICTLYDVGPDYLVMELVEGETLAARLRQGPIAEGEALEIARQIAAALEAAHEKGVVHRDLKPANVILTPQGSVKVLDFGLAKAARQEAGDSSTMTIGITEPGTAIGTPAYMAPEQAQGLAVDRSSADIWAFGVVLYETLTGQRLFAGKTAPETLAAVLTKEPDLSRVPRRVQRLLRRCLERDPRKRLRDIGEFPYLLDDSPAPASPWRGKLPWAVAAVFVVLTAVAVWAPWRTDPTAELASPLVLLPVDFGPGVSLFAENGPAFAISPDGTRVVYSSRDADGKILLYWRRLNQPDATPLRGTDSAFDPFFSPSGEEVGFYADGRLKKIELDTGAITDLANAINPSGASWGDNGTIVFHRAPSLDLWTIPANGGEPAQVPRGAGGRGRFWPQVLPGSDTILYTAVERLGGDIGRARVEVMDFSGNQPRTIVEGATFGRYAASGDLLYIRSGTLFARPLDLDRMEFTGPEVA